MADKLNAGDQFPQITLKIDTNDTIILPDQLDSNYAIVLFYRGHW